ncbi:MAG: hypothetical protein V4649_14645 [Bacteroidota bacterium]
MKKTLSLLTLIVLLFTNCRKIKEETLLNFDVAFEETVAVPPPGVQSEGGLPAGGASLDFPSYAIATNIKQKLDQYNTKSEKVTDVKLLLHSIQILRPQYHYFDYLDSVELYISAPNQPEKLIAYRYDVPKGIFTLDFKTVQDVNLKQYLLQDTIYLRMRAHVNAVPPGDEVLRVRSTFQVRANPLL